MKYIYLIFQNAKMIIFNLKYKIYYFVIDQKINIKEAEN